MSLKTNIDAFATRVGTEFKAVRTVLGANANLTTTDKTTLVNAINELKADIATATVINDSTTNTTATYSSSKIQSLLTATSAALKDELVNGAGAAYDTLVELQNLIIADESSISSLLTSVGNRVRFDAAQTLTAPQQAQVLANIGAYSTAEIGDVTASYVTTFEASLL